MNIFKKPWVLITGLLIITTALVLLCTDGRSFMSEFFIVSESEILNFVFVFFATLFGTLSNKNTAVESGSGTGGGGGRDHSFSNPHQQHHHHHHHYYHLRRRRHHPRRHVGGQTTCAADTNIQDTDKLSSLSSSSDVAGNGNGLPRRNSCSFPGLTQESFRKPEPEWRRYYDDNDVSTYQYCEPSHSYHHPQPSAPPVPESYDTQYSSNTKTILPTAPPYAAERRRRKREERRTVRLRKRVEKPVDKVQNDLQFDECSVSPPSIQPAESPEPPPPLQPTESPEPPPQQPSPLQPPPTAPVSDRIKEQAEKQIADRDFEIEKRNFGEFLFQHFFGEPPYFVSPSPSPPQPSPSPPPPPPPPYQSFINYLQRY